MNVKEKLVCGFGVNDTPDPVMVSPMVSGSRKKNRQNPFYSVWVNMLTRCYSKIEHARYPTYIGCTVCQEWKYFSVFRDWMKRQPWEGNQLDKDILIPGNKLYSPDTCVFIPSHLNNFTTAGGAARGAHPIGVYWQKNASKYQSKCSNPFTGETEYLGLFDCPAAAHEAWRKRKHEHALRYADKQTDPRIAQALRVRYAPAEAE